MLYYFILFILWLCFWSFSTVLISRWNSGKWWIMLGRSECPHCSHILTAGELVPVFSWIIQLGKCKNCQTKIPSYYPLSELFMGTLFVWAGWVALWFGYTLQDAMLWIFIFWTFTTWVYLIYDLRYMEIPDQILIPAILLTLVLLGVGYIVPSYNIFYDFSSYKNFHTFLTDHIFAAIFVYSFFFLQILIPGTIHFIRQKKYWQIVWLLISYVIFPFIMIWDFFTGKTHTDNSDAIPTWIGWGDLRIALFIWLTLWGIHSMSTLVFAYIIWSIAWLTMLFYWKIMSKEVSHEIPFWPFLAIGWILSLTFYDTIINYLRIINI